MRQKDWRLAMKVQTMNAEDRRKDAREKIMLGGLLVKAGLREEDTAVLYGAILDMRSKLQKPRSRDAYRAAGEKALQAAPKAKVKT